MHKLHESVAERLKITFPTCACICYLVLHHLSMLNLQDTFSKKKKGELESYFFFVVSKMSWIHQKIVSGSGW